MEYGIGVTNTCTRLFARYAVETHIGTVKSLASQKVGKTPFFLSGGADESIRFGLKRAADD